MKIEENIMNLVNDEPMEWASDCYRGYFGYCVHINNGVWPAHVGFPAFTHEQMIECKRITESLGKLYGYDSFPWLIYDEEARTWSEVYYDDMSEIEDVLTPFVVDGLELYALGLRSDWAWGAVSEGYDYVTA